MTTTRPRLRVLARATALTAAAGVIGAATIVGCSGSSSDAASTTSSAAPITGPEGTATVSNPAPYMELWDPCSLPKSLQEQFKFVKARSVDNIEPQRTCTYSRTPFELGAPGYVVNVIVTNFPFAESRANSSLYNPKATTIGDGHPAVIADMQEGDRGRQLLWGTSYGSVLIQAFPVPSDNPVNTQQLLNEFSAAAYPYIPK
ncbi:DUF3558 family protein [Gordonia sp. NPDC003424]